MIRDCKSVGNPLPIYQEIGGGFSVTLPLKEPVRTIIYKDGKKELELTFRQKDIINALKNGPLNRIQIMQKMDTSLADRAIQNERSNLKKLGLIKSEGKGKAIIWILID